MHQKLDKAIRDVIADAGKASLDEHGFLQYLDSGPITRLIVEFDLYCKKHGRPRIRMAFRDDQRGVGSI